MLRDRERAVHCKYVMAAANLENENEQRRQAVWHDHMDQIHASDGEGEKAQQNHDDAHGNINLAVGHDERQRDDRR